MRLLGSISLVIVSCVIVQEVFKTEQSHEIAMSQIMGRCYVMFVKDYFKMRPEVKLCQTLRLSEAFQLDA